MRTNFWKAAIGAAAMAAVATGALADGHGTPKAGGTLDFVVGSKIPSYDAHVETTFGMIHPISPFYSLLIRVNPNEPASNDFECDVCESFEASADGLTYTYKIRKGLQFHINRAGWSFKRSTSAMTAAFCSATAFGSE